MVLYITAWRIFYILFFLSFFFFNNFDLISVKNTEYLSTKGMGVNCIYFKL